MRSYTDTVGIVGTTAPSSSSVLLPPATLRLYVWLEFPGFAAVVSQPRGDAGEVRRAARADLLPAYGV